jgi:hypothetical protein
VIQGAVGSSLSMGLRSMVMALGAIGMLVATNPRLMLAVVGVITLIVLPARRRHPRDRGAAQCRRAQPDRALHHDRRLECGRARRGLG